MDQVRRFLFERNPIRGQHVTLDSSWQQIVEQTEAEGTALVLLGQALTAATLLVETLNIDGSISLQIRGNGAINLLVAEASSRGTIRGLVRQNADIGEQQSLQQIFDSDKLVITIQNGNAKPYQGIVPLTGDTLNLALQSYFDQSEQLPTRIWLACDRQSAGGLLLQRLPGERADEDAWHRLLTLADTTRDEELLGLEAPQLLHRLFHEEDLRLFDAAPVTFACTCSSDRIRDMLASLGKAEVASILEDEGEIAVTCEFCKARYAYDKVDLAQLFNDSEFQSISPTRH